MTRTFILLALGTVLPAVAQIQGPQLGYISRDGELRRIEGLSVSSRLSAPLELSLACSRTSAAPGSAMRWALCATDSATMLLDLSGAVEPRKVAVAPFSDALWSPNGRAVLIDATLRVFGLELSLAETSSKATAISDSGIVSDQAIAFDGEAQLSVRESAVHRMEAGKAEEIYVLDFTPKYLIAAADHGILAASGQRLARITRHSGEVIYFDLPVEASGLRLLADGSVLFADPAPDEPGWLFRWRRDEGGSVRFVPGIPVEVRQ